MYRVQEPVWDCLYRTAPLIQTTTERSLRWTCEQEDKHVSGPSLLQVFMKVKHCGGKGGEWQYELFADVFSNIQETILPKALGQLHPSSLNSVCMNRWTMALLPTKLPYYEWPSPTCHIYTTVKESTSAVESVQGVSAGCWRPQPHTAFSEDPPPNKPLDCCLSHTQRVVFSPAGPNWKAFHHVHC